MKDLEQEMTVAEFVAERMKADPKIQLVVSEARLFDELQSSQGWKKLYEKVVSDKTKVTADLARRMMAGEKIDPAEIEFYRGFYQGAVFVLEHPAQAEKSLERAAKVAWLLVQSTTAQEPEEKSPYLG